jgi:hypothetical protein
MIRLRYPLGLVLAAAMLGAFAVALSVRAAEALASAEGIFTGSAGGQPSEEEFKTYYLGVDLKSSLVQLVPWVVLAAALVAIGALMLLVLRSRERGPSVRRRRPRYGTR